MAEDIYKAGDIQGYDFAFDAVGQIVDWSRVVDEAQRRTVRLTLALGTLRTQEGNVGDSARASVTIPRGSDETVIRQRVYASVRDYVRNAARRRYRQRLEEEGDYDEEEIDDMVSDADVQSEPNTVALLSAVTML